MKKALLYGLSAALLLSLAACGAAQAEQPKGPDPAPTPSAVQTEPPQETPVVEPLSAPRELTEEELFKEFEAAYAEGQDFLALLDETEFTSSRI